MKVDRGLNFIFLFLFPAICLAKPPIVFTDPSKALVINKPNYTFNIKVQSNPSTGYSWFLKSYTTGLIVPLKRRFYPPKKSMDSKFMAGTPGYEEWTFKIKPESFTVPQLASITLIYLRPWDEQSSQIINFKVIIQNAH